MIKEAVQKLVGIIKKALHRFKPSMKEQVNQFEEQISELQVTLNEKSAELTKLENKLDRYNRMTTKRNSIGKRIKEIENTQYGIFEIERPKKNSEELLRLRVEFKDLKDKRPLIKNSKAFFKLINETYDQVKEIKGDIKYKKKLIENTFISENEYSKLSDTFSSHYENISEDKNSNITTVLYIADTDNQTTKRYSSYEDLWEENFKDRFIEDFDNFMLNELEGMNVFEEYPQLMSKLQNHYPEIKFAYSKAHEYQKLAKELYRNDELIPDRGNYSVKTEPSKVKQKSNKKTSIKELREKNKELEADYKKPERKQSRGRSR